MKPSSGATLPPSATHAGVAWAGVVTMLAAVALLNFWPPFDQIAYLALIVMGCAALGIFVPDLLWQKVQRRALAPPGPGNWPRVAVKCVGLAGSIGFVALLYWLFPEYNQGAEFYGNYYAALKVLLPPWAVLAAPYLYWVDRRMAQPLDGLWQLGQLLLGRWRGLDAAADRPASAGLAGEGLFPAADVHLLLRQPEQAAALRSQSAAQLPGHLRLGLLLDVLHRRQPGVDDLPDGAQGHRHAHPLDRTDDARLGQRAGVLSAVLVADQQAVHRLRHRPVVWRVVPRPTVAVRPVVLPDPVAGRRVCLGHDRLRRALLEPDSSRHHHQRPVSLHQASGLPGKEPVLVADLDAVHAQRRRRGHAAALPAARGAQPDLLPARQDRGAAPGARSGVPALRRMDRRPRPAARPQSYSGYRCAGALAAEVCQPTHRRRRSARRSRPIRIGACAPRGSRSHSVRVG